MRRSTEPMVQLIEADRLANKVSFDVINLTEPADMVRYKKENFIQPVTLPDRDMLMPGTYDPDNYYFALGITPMYGIYNTQSLKKNEAPTSLKALLTDSKWIGKVVISRPSRGGTGAAALLNVADAVGRDFLKDVTISPRNEPPLSKIKINLFGDDRLLKEGQELSAEYDKAVGLK